MNILDSLPEMKEKDPSMVLNSTGLYLDQCEEAWEKASSLSVPDEYKQVKNIVVVGMGGSRYAPLMAKELLFDQITTPYEIVDGYHLPRYVRDESLVILSSYSGTTEEVVSCALEALSKGAKVMGIAKGGQVEELMKQNNLPGYIFSGRYNPCGQPRIGNGYLFMGHLGLLKSLGVIGTSTDDIKDAIEYAREYSKTLTADVSIEKNKAKELALKLHETHPFIIGSEFLRGFVNTFANELNETAKIMAHSHVLPELNHHLLEGLQHPDTLHTSGIFVFFHSNFYSDPVKKRAELTKEIVEKQDVGILDVYLKGPTKMAQHLEALCLSNYASFYLAMLYNTDPAKLPWVDYFKEKLNS